MIYLILFLYLVIFIELFIALKIMDSARAVLKLASESLGVLNSKKMTDLEKEKFMRRNSLVMMMTTLGFVGKFLLILVVIYGVNILIEYFSPTLAQQIMESFFSVSYMVLLTCVALVYIWIRNVIRSKL